MPRFAKGPGYRASFTPRVGKVTRSIGIRGPEGGSIGTIRATFSNRVLAENKIRISGTGEFIGTPVTKSIFSEPGIQNTFSNAVFSSSAPNRQSSESTGRIPVSEQRKLSGIVQDSVRVIPQRPLPRNGREFIQGLTDFKPLSIPVVERPASADSIRNSDIVISSLISTVKPSHSETTADKSQELKRRFVTRTLNELAEQARISSERNIGIRNTGNQTENVGTSTTIGDSLRRDQGMYPVIDQPPVSSVDSLNRRISTDQSTSAVSLQNSVLYKPYSGSSVSIPTQDTKAIETKSTVHDAGNAKNILRLRQAKMAGNFSDSDAPFPKAKLGEKTHDKNDLFTIKPVKIWKFINNGWNQVLDGYYQLREPGQLVILFIRGKQKKFFPEPKRIVIGNTTFSDSALPENKKKKNHSLVTLPSVNEKLLPVPESDQDLQAFPVLVSQMKASTHEQFATGLVPLPKQGENLLDPATLIEEQSATIYQFPIPHFTESNEQSAEGSKNHAAEAFNPPKLVYVVDKDAGNNRVEQAASGAVLAHESADGMVHGNDVAEASEKFTQQSKSPIIRLFPIVDGSEVAFWSHIRATGPLMRDDWKKVAIYYKERFRPVAIKNKKGLSQEATASDLTLIFNGLSVKDVDLAA